VAVARAVNLAYNTTPLAVVAVRLGRNLQLQDEVHSSVVYFSAVLGAVPSLFWKEVWNENSQLTVPVALYVVQFDSPNINWDF
jgi:hypothetical protein